MSASLRVEARGDARVLVLDRPGVRNALDEELIASLRTAVEEAGRDDAVRAVVLRGAGKSFCAGADLHYMRRMADFKFLDNVRDAQALGGLFLALSDCPRPVVSAVHGAAIGGGVGLVAATDIALAEEGTQFAFSEVRLGIVPGVISPFVLRRLGPAACRRLFLTGERFDAAQAHRLGLVDEVVEPGGLDAALDRVLGQLRHGGPGAQAAAKGMLDEVSNMTVAEAMQHTPEWIARQRATDEAREGFAAFFDKRRPGWAPGE